MYIVVIYDVTEDDVRNKIADTLKAFGLARIQKSAYIGRLPPALVKELAEKLRKAARGANADVIILKVDRRVIDAMIRIGPPQPPRHDDPALH